MAVVLEYDMRVTGAANVRNSLSSMERMFAQSNARMARQLGARAGSTARAGGADATARREAASLARQQDAEARRWQSLAKRTADHRLREDIRAAKASEAARIRSLKGEERERIRATRGEERERLRSIRRAELEGSRMGRQSARTRMQFEAGVDESRRRFRNETLGGGARRVMGGVAGVGMAGGALVGIGGTMLAASAISQSVRLDEMTRRLAISGRESGTAGMDPESIRKQLMQTGIASGIDPEKLAGGLAAAVAKTGDLQGAMQNLPTIATATQATGADATDLYTLQADALQKFGLSADDAQQALAMLNAQGKKGAFELKALAAQAPRAFAAAAGFGFKGMDGLRDIGGLLQVARNVTGSDEQAAFATEAMLRQLTAKAPDIQSGKAFGGNKVEVFRGGDPTKGARNIRELIPEIIAASGGNAVQLQKVFGEEGIRLTRPFTNAYRDASEKAGGGAAGDKAGREAMSKIISDAADVPGNWGDIQADAADAMKATSVQLEILNTKLKDAISTEFLPVLQSLIPHFVEMVPAVSRLAQDLVALGTVVSNNPLAGLGALVSASFAMEFAKAGMANVIQTALTKQLGLLSVGGLAIGTMVAAVSFAQLNVESMVEKAKRDVDKAAASGDEIREKARQEFAETGTLTPETRKELETLGQTEQSTIAKGRDIRSRNKSWADKVPGFSAAAAIGGTVASWFGDDTLQKETTLSEATVNRDYGMGAQQTQFLLDITSSADSLKKAGTSLDLAAKKLEAAAGDKPNRGDTPSPVKNPRT